MAFQNLPRYLRFRRENIILCGVIPGPNEPRSHMNSYLEPLVDELRCLSNGVLIKTPNGVELKIFAYLMCLSCDIPAARKCGGFVGHNAIKGCSRCLKSFPTAHFGEKPNYRGFEPGDWIPRNNDDHCMAAVEHKLTTTQEARKKIERQFGVKYSVLTSLPYYDSIQFTVIDPMHTLLLGSAKHVMVVWKEKAIIPESTFAAIQKCIDSLCSS